MATQQPPLTGIRVIDYTHFLAGPHLSRCLSVMGADVIKVERPKAGDAGRVHPYVVNGQSGYFLQQNMGKRGLCINLKDSRGHELMRRLISSADVFVENYRPGTLAKLGLGYKDLSKINPRLVYCSVSAFGHSGPESSRPGFGLIAEAKSGAMQMVGEPGKPPPLFRMPIADMYAGTHGAAAVCAALLGRHNSGKGQHVDIALYDCMISMHDYAVQAYTFSGGNEVPVQTGYDLPGSTLYGLFAARDGYVVIAAHMDDTWKRFAKLIGGDALATDERFLTLADRNANREAILKIVGDWVLAQPSAKTCTALLDKLDVPCTTVPRIDEVLAEPQVAARNMLIEQTHPVLGKVKLPNLPFRFSDADTTPRLPAPLLGQHNREIALGLGYVAADVDAMTRDGVLYAEAAVKTL